jgi:diaminopropionate ammonia-lyase
MNKTVQNPNAASPATLLAQCPVHNATPLLTCDALAQQINIASLLVKNEGHRALGSFKSLGGTFAGLSALARSMEMSVEALFSLSKEQQSRLPRLVCASDGNHGLAVAAAAKLVGGKSKIYLHKLVSAERIGRIAAQGAEVFIVDGNYDDAVLAAEHAAISGEGLLIADTGDALHDPIVADVMSGYRVIADEIRVQIAQEGLPIPTHVFVQAGVGGLAAAIADGLTDMLAAPARIIVVEPRSAACVAPALLKKAAVQIEGDLETCADMLSCGIASTPALDILLNHRATAIDVSEEEIDAATALLNTHPDINTTHSGATGFAGLLSALSQQSQLNPYQMGHESRALIIATEVAVKNIARF